MYIQTFEECIQDCFKEYMLLVYELNVSKKQAEEMREKCISLCQKD